MVPLGSEYIVIAIMFVIAMLLIVGGLALISRNSLSKPILAILVVWGLVNFILGIFQQRSYVPQLLILLFLIIGYMIARQGTEQRINP
jgi:hypothetical protein